MKYILLTGLLLGSLTVQAQVSGTVKDQAGEPIIGANVFWKNIPGGVATREDGTFFHIQTRQGQSSHCKFCRLRKRYHTSERQERRSGRSTSRGDGTE